jgi:ribosome-associated protein
MARPGQAPQDFPMSPEGLLVLGQLLKAAGLAGSGGEAKHLIQSGSVRVNGEVEVRRGRRLHAGDLVAVSGRTVRVVGAPRPS